MRGVKQNWCLCSAGHLDSLGVLRWQLAVYSSCLYEQCCSLFYNLTPSFLEYPADTGRIWGVVFPPFSQSSKHLGLLRYCHLVALAGFIL